MHKITLLLILLALRYIRDLNIN